MDHVDGVVAEEDAAACYLGEVVWGAVAVEVVGEAVRVGFAEGLGRVSLVERMVGFVWGCTMHAGAFTERQIAGVTVRRDRIARTSFIFAMRRANRSSCRLGKCDGRKPLKPGLQW